MDTITTTPVVIAPIVAVEEVKVEELKPTVVVVEETKPTVVVVEELKPTVVVEESKAVPVAVEEPKSVVTAVEEPKEQVEPLKRTRAAESLTAKPSVAVVVVETEVARMLQKLVTDDAPVTWSSLPGIVTKAMEIAEGLYGLNGPQKRQLVIDALTQLVRTVDKEAGISVADPVFEALLPSLVDHFVAVSKDGLSINLTPPTPAGCLAFLCCAK